MEQCRSLYQPLLAFGFERWDVIIEKFDPVNDVLISTLEWDTQFDAQSLLYGNRSALCYWDFIDPDWNFVLNGGGYYYYIWIYAYNEAGFSEDALFVEYLDY